MEEAAEEVQVELQAVAAEREEAAELVELVEQRIPVAVAVALELEYQVVAETEVQEL